MGLWLDACVRAHVGAPRCKTIFQSCQARPQTFKVLSTTMSKHLFAIRDGCKTDIQHNARTLPQSLPIFLFFFTLSLFQSVRPSSLLFPSHPTTSSPTDPQHPPHRLQLAPASLPAFWRGFTLLRLWVGEGCCQETAGKRTCLEPLWEA